MGEATCRASRRRRQFFCQRPGFLATSNEISAARHGLAFPYRASRAIGGAPIRRQRFSADFQLPERA